MTELDHSDPGQRGTLTISDRAIEKVATQAASSVDGVAPSGSTLDKMMGRRLPKVSSHVRGDQARVEVEVAVVWPLSLSDVATEVRSTVGRAVSGFSGLTVTAVDVTVARVERATKSPARRVE